MVMTTTPAPTSEAEYLRRRATSAMIDLLCQTSPAQAAFREAGRQLDQLTNRLKAGENVVDEVSVCCEQLMEAADGIETQWHAVFDRQYGPQ